MLSDSPPERDLAWSEAGIEGAWRFVHRLWRMSAGAGGRSTWLGDGADEALDRKLHRTIATVAANIESLAFHKEVDNITELSTTAELGRASCKGQGCEYV